MFTAKSHLLYFHQHGGLLLHHQWPGHRMMAMANGILRYREVGVLAGFEEYKNRWAGGFWQNDVYRAILHMEPKVRDHVGATCGKDMLFLTDPRMENLIYAIFEVGSVITMEKLGDQLMARF